MILFEYSLNQSFTLFQHFNHYPILSLWVSLNHFSRRTFFIYSSEWNFCCIHYAYYLWCVLLRKMNNHVLSYRQNDRFHTNSIPIQSTMFNARSCRWWKDAYLFIRWCQFRELYWSTTFRRLWDQRLQSENAYFIRRLRDRIFDSIGEETNFI